MEDAIPWHHALSLQVMPFKLALALMIMLGMALDPMAVFFSMMSVNPIIPVRMGGVLSQCQVMCAFVIQDGPALIVLRILMSVPATPARMVEIVLMVLIFILVLALTNGQARSAKYHSKLTLAVEEHMKIVHDGGTEMDPLISKFCGSTLPAPITTSGNKMWIKFKADVSTSKGGFLALYEVVCREEFFELTGTLTSPNYPNGYSRNQECIYTISVENNKQILLNFTHFQLDGHQTCTSGYVEVRNGGYETSPLVGQYCGSKAPPPIISHSNQLWIKFKSDNTLQYRVFKAHWDGTTTGCGGTLTTSTGSFTSPNYPMPYSHNAECYWLIEINAGSVIELQFEQFHLDSSAGCNFDYLAVCTILLTFFS
ncbi:hypothetical protein chiPu_0000153 [Chiloscyllium punctatum]|uniref:CUB domain-containing protein n=1 Tax=Chiloscyllium punctatum TaxID=137246 RepID=A0A401RS62_CHIPU|nr:hypothetical protein [Chiloscyllium punctatum]